MPYKVKSRWLRGLAGALFGATALLISVPGIAAADCATGPDSEAFAAFGDGATYMPAPGGTFENGAPGWSLTRSHIAEGNEPWYVSGAGSHSLAIEAGGVAVSPPVCVGSEYPTFRFFARQLGSAGGSLQASLRWVDLLGVTLESPAGSVTPDGAWTPSPVMMLGSSLPHGFQAPP